MSKKHKKNWLGVREEFIPEEFSPEEELEEADGLDEIIAQGDRNYEVDIKDVKPEKEEWNKLLLGVVIVVLVCIAILLANLVYIFR